MSCEANRLRKHELLSPRRWGLVLRVALDLLVARHQIATVPLRRLGHPCPAGSLGHYSQSRRWETLECVRRYTNFFLSLLPASRRRRCLPRSLVLFRWARRLGLPASLHLAMHRQGPGRDGHSWVLIDGKPLFESVDPDTRFVELYRYPPGLEHRA